LFGDRQLENVVIEARCSGEPGDDERHLLNLYALSLPPDRVPCPQVPPSSRSTTSPRKRNVLRNAGRIASACDEKTVTVVGFLGVKEVLVAFVPGARLQVVAKSRHGRLNCGGRQRREGELAATPSPVRHHALRYLPAPIFHPDGHSTMYNVLAISTASSITTAGTDRRHSATFPTRQRSGTGCARDGAV